MRKFILITNPYKDCDLKFSNEIVAYIRKKGGEAKVVKSSIRNEDTGDRLLSVNWKKILYFLQLTA